MGRLILNVLLSFAQFERELISERTRDKIAAARRRGKWTGGPVVLGYQVSADGRGLEVVPAEAEVVRAAFELYEKTLSIGATAKRLNLRGYCQKKRTRKDGTTKGGRPFDKDVVHRLLRNPIYAGKVRVDEQLFAGEHDAIVPLVQLERGNALLAWRSTGRGKRKGRPEYEVLNIKEVAALLKLAEKTVYAMANAGELPAFKIRGQWRIKRAELDRWIDEQPRGGASEEDEDGDE